MTFRTSINSKGNPRDLLKRGFKSMFANYGEESTYMPPVDSNSKKTKKK